MRNRWIMGAVATIVALLLMPAVASASVFGHPSASRGRADQRPVRPSCRWRRVPTERSSSSAVPARVRRRCPRRRRPVISIPAGTSLYTPTIDPPTYGASFFHPYQAGCTTAIVVSEAEGPLSCTGSETDPSADWPAFTTEGPPVAGPGVNPFLPRRRVPHGPRRVPGDLRRAPALPLRPGSRLLLRRQLLRDSAAAAARAHGVVPGVAVGHARQRAGDHRDRVAAARHDLQLHQGGGRDAAQRGTRWRRGLGLHLQRRLALQPLLRRVCEGLHPPLYGGRSNRLAGSESGGGGYRRGGSTGPSR